MELPLGDQLYRLDPALGGSTLGLSQRGPGSWRWHYLAELKWDGTTLRSKAVERRFWSGWGVRLLRRITSRNGTVFEVNLQPER